MKKTILALSVLASATAMAAPVGQTFTGLGVGLDLTTTKYKNADKRATGVGVVVDYGFDYGNNLVGLVEGKVKLNSSKLVDRKEDGYSWQVKENARVSVSYLQGYRVLPDLLPYVKVGYTVTKIKGEGKSENSSVSISDTASGFNYGLGVKYAVSSNVEMGVEYVRHSAKFNGVNEKANTFGANVTYRF